MNHCADILAGLVHGLMHGRLGNRFLEINHKEIFRFDQGRALARHEEHLSLPVDSGAQVSEGIAQSLVADDP